MKSEAKYQVVKIQSVSLIEDLRQAPPAVRWLAAFGVSSLGSYVLCFGALAVAGIWRSSFLSVSQILIVSLILITQAVITWGLRFKPLKSGITMGLILATSIGIIAVRAASPSDIGQVVIVIGLPFALCTLNGFLLRSVAKSLVIPSHRGEAVPL